MITLVLFALSSSKYINFKYSYNKFPISIKKPISFEELINHYWVAQVLSIRLHPILRELLKPCSNICFVCESHRKVEVLIECQLHFEEQGSFSYTLIRALIIPYFRHWVLRDRCYKEPMAFRGIKEGLP